MNKQGPLLYKITCEKPPLLNDEVGLKDIRNKFINDPIRLRYIEEIQKLLDYSIPSFIVDKINNTIETKYDEETTNVLNKIKEDLNKYIVSAYGEYLSFTIKEDNK